jgi:DegV family protein with EDD domain
MRIAIVTDSACDLPPEIVAEYRIAVIPLHIHFDGHSYLDGVDLSREAFYRRLREPGPVPTTAVPGPDAFAQTYQQLAAQGATEILSIHISGNLSSIVDIARLAVREINSVPVTVVDSGQLSLGAGLSVWAAAQAAEGGSSTLKIVELVGQRAARTHVFAALDTLEFLRRSGRMNLVGAGLGSLLHIKPLLKLHQGSVTSERVRTRKRAIARQ